MMANIIALRKNWLELRVVIRRFPWLDVILSSVLILYGLGGLLCPELIVINSAFHIFRDSIVFVSSACIISGIGSYYGAYMRNQLLRTGFGMFSLYMFITLFVAVGTYTGHLAWGALMIMQFLICAAVVAI